MESLPRSARLMGAFSFVLAAVTLVAAGCSTNGAPVAVAPAKLSSASAAVKLKTPALIEYDQYTEALEYWPLGAHGSDSPKMLSPSLGLTRVRGMVADGRTVTLANSFPSEVVSYDVDTKTTRILSLANSFAPGSGPYDLAIDRHHTIYSLPYGAKVVATHNLRANCPGPIRLDATSSHLFFTDTYPEALLHRALSITCRSDACVDQRSYPNARGRAFYLGGLPGAITTIPNRLPN